VEESHEKSSLSHGRCSNGATSALAQIAPAKMSSDQAREENAYAFGVQTAIWGQPFVDNVHTLYAGFKAGALTSLLLDGLLAVDGSLLRCGNLQSKLARGRSKLAIIAAAHESIGGRTFRTCPGGLTTS
jgi:hypothetical protein